MTVSATTLALMLTLLGLSSDIDADIKGGHFERIRQIALVDVTAFVLATVLLVLIVVPVDGSTPIPEGWFSAIYYTVSVAAALLGGGLVAVMLLLYAAIRDLILVLGPGDQNPLIAEEKARGRRRRRRGRGGSGRGNRGGRLTPSAGSSRGPTAPLAAVSGVRIRRL